MPAVGGEWLRRRHLRPGRAPALPLTPLLAQPALLRPGLAGVARRSRAV
jgi:hypothetical protein